MFHDIGVLTVVATIVLITYLIIRRVYFGGMGVKSPYRKFIILLKYTAVLLLSVTSLLMVFAFALFDDKTSHPEKLNLPIGGKFHDLPVYLPIPNAYELELKIAQIVYGFRDDTFATVYFVQNPEKFWNGVKSNHLEKMRNASPFYEHMICGLGGDSLLSHWVISFEHVARFYELCEVVMSDNVQINTIDFDADENNSTLSVSRIGKSNFFMIAFCFRCL